MMMMMMMMIINHRPSPPSPRPLPPFLPTLPPSHPRRAFQTGTRPTLCVDRYACSSGSAGARPPSHPSFILLHARSCSRSTYSSCRSPVSQLCQHMVDQPAAAPSAALEPPFRADHDGTPAEPPQCYGDDQQGTHPCRSRSQSRL